MANKAVNKKKKGMSGEDLAGMHIYKDDHNRYCLLYTSNSKC